MGCRRNGCRLAALVGSVMLAGCTADPHALLLTIESPRPLQAFDLRVRDLAASKSLLERAGETVTPGRDVSAEPLRVTLEFARAGRYRIHLIGRTGSGLEPLFALRDFDVDGTVKATIVLQPLQDKDGDGLPDCARAGELDCGELACEALDCDDDDRGVSPFAAEVCGNDKDDDCSAGCEGKGGKVGDKVCEDEDGDGASGPDDCDEGDPCRSRKLKEADSLCQQTGEPFPALPKACLDRLASEGVAPPVAPFCGDGIDQDCNGQDVACRVDEDCDGISPPADCDDDDAAINPKATEDCDRVDNNCNGVIDEGCVACDVDGDGHAAPTAGDDCVDEGGKSLPRDDPDDFDSGVFPGASDPTTGAEAGTAALALRGTCRDTPTKRAGVTARDVDYDGDGKPASADGCPSVACDGDGDGFVGSQCDPPASEADCDDTDPTVFPGAPDRCGDTVAQNCVGDQPCGANDSDGDGYVAGVDCADDDAERHPWAVERCDGVDNDCDGLIDEGNPDGAGKPIPVGDQAKLCNDNNEGQCGGGGPATKGVCNPLSDANCGANGRLLSGTCACSRATPKGTRADGRVPCAGEDLAAVASPRCFGATQPEIERCDDKDWDCDGRRDDPEGSRPLLDAGKSCSTGAGSCVAGQVVGCDLGRGDPDGKLIADVLKKAGVEHNPFWLCKGGVFPVPEVCNGKDDDCDGALAKEESDGDGDGYLPCAGCSAGGDRLALAAQFAGCDDCDDGAIEVNPDAKEPCNGVDDNCQGGLSDDGASECQSGQTCCGSLGACYNLSSDPYHCGSCEKQCDVSAGEKCSGGSCVCGDTGGSCSSGQDCVAGQCRCVIGGSCSGCCDGDTCRPSTVDHCGVNGGDCTTCSLPSDECEEATCQWGSCGVSQRGDGTSCDSGDGTCRQGSCCKDDRCWNTSTDTCDKGKWDDNHCGVGGAICVECWSGESCDWGYCVSI